MKTVIMAAVDEDYGLGKGGEIPWDLPWDLWQFAQRTMQEPSAVLMGRITWESLRRKPLPNRFNAVLTRSRKVLGADLVDSEIERMYARIKGLDLANCFIIGGESVFNWAINITDEIYLSEIPGSFACDRFFPSIKEGEFLRVSRKCVGYRDSFFFDTHYLRIIS